MPLHEIERDLKTLVTEIGCRHPGSPGNQQAVAYAARRLRESGWDVQTSGFDCIDWERGRLTLTIDGRPVGAQISPYAPSCDVETEYVPVQSLPELRTAELDGKIAVLYGAIAREQIMPKGFVFYNPDHHQEIIHLLEEKRPLAIVAITSRSPETAGGMYPFPLFEDGDFHIPSVYLSEEEGKAILSAPAGRIYLSIASRRIPSRGENVAGLKPGKSGKRIVFCAHIDTKMDTPGALDNATGVAALLELSRLARDYRGGLGVELLLLNGEDYYAVPGQMLYLRQNEDRFGEMVLAVNTDAAGCRGMRTGYCGFELSGALRRAMARSFADDHFTEIAPWEQSDHMIFVYNGVPAIALSSENLVELFSRITHTERDSIDKVDPAMIGQIAHGMRHLIDEVEETL